MQLSYNDKEYDIVIEKKKSNKNTYIRVKKDLKIHVTTTLFTPKGSIDKLIRMNYDKICKMIDFQEKKLKNRKKAIPLERISKLCLEISPLDRFLFPAF
mgnify:CR=1 FL=1